MVGGFETVQIIRPLLHHNNSVINEARAVVGATVCVPDRMG